MTSELHELIDSMTSIQAKAALQQIASLAHSNSDGDWGAIGVKSDVIWIIEETAVNFDGLVKTFETPGNELDK